jgi:hypothetical protein
VGTEVAIIAVLADGLRGKASSGNIQINRVILPFFDGKRVEQVEEVETLGHFLENVLTFTKYNCTKKC